MDYHQEDAERTPLLRVNGELVNGDRRLSKLAQQEEDIISSHVSVDEQKLAGSSVGERLPYNEYTSVDFLHDLVSQ